VEEDVSSGQEEDALARERRAEAIKQAGADYDDAPDALDSAASATAGMQFTDSIKAALVVQKTFG
jgi:hypothetical protein